LRRNTGLARFVDPLVLARIGNLELLARTVVDGFINGLHRAPHLGVSLDFAEHRSYMPGDDIRRIDWKVYGRTDRYYVKQFEAETNADMTVVLDSSKSMRWASGPLSKLDYGKFLGASLAYFSNQQRDRVGCIIYDETGVRDYVPNSAKHLEALLHTIERAGTPAAEPDAAGGGGIDGPQGGWRGRLSGAAESLRRGRGVAAEVKANASLDDVMLVAADRLRRRGFVVVISDFYAEPDAVARALGHLRGKGQDVIVFHVLDPAELDFPFQEATSFEDLETGERIPVVPETVRARYRELVQAHTDALGTALGNSRIDYTLVSTAEPLDGALFRYLSMRQRMMKVR
jgi:uncharacterized protein (DUF58 family)